MAEPQITRRKRRTPEAIRDLIIAAAGAEFEEHGYSGATTAAIARRADVTEAQIFRFFESKQDLFREAIFQPLNQHFSDFHASTLADGGGADFKANAHRYIDELQDFMEAHSRSLMSLIVAKEYKGSAQGLNELDGLRAYFARGTAMMQGRTAHDAEIPPELMVRVSFAAVLGSVIFKDWLFPAGLASDEAIRAAIAGFTIDGIRANEKG